MYGKAVLADFCENWEYLSTAQVEIPLGIKRIWDVFTQSSLIKL